MIVFDRLIVNGVAWVLEKVATAVDAELNDDTKLREELLAAQMRLELGEIDEEEFARTERDVLARLREIRSQREGGASPSLGEKGVRVTGVEATFEGDEGGRE